MSADPFTERLAKVRHRFVSALNGKIDDACAAIPKLSGSAPAVVEAVDTAFRRMHGIGGVGPTLGFAATGRAARTAEHILLTPRHEQRGLTESEVALLNDALRGLRETATRELHTFYAGLAASERPAKSELA
jgi:hypothetical protein